MGSRQPGAMVAMRTTCPFSGSRRSGLMWMPGPIASLSSGIWSMLTVSRSLGRHAAATLPCSTSPTGDQHAAPALTWAAAAMIALTVRRQRPQSAPAPHASATSLEVHAPPATTSATTCLVAPVHRHTNISALPLLRQRDQRQRDTGSGADHPRRDGCGHVSEPFAMRTYLWI